VYEGVREPATGIVPWGIVGYTDNAWQYCKFDREAAKAKLAEAGYPNGEGFPEIKLSFNTGSGHEDVMALIQSDLAEIGVTAVFDGVEWAQYLDKLGAGDFQIGRLGWIADYPIMDNFLYPLFKTGSGDNYSRYSNPEVDAMLDEARTIADGAERVAKYQEIEKKIGDDVPVIPIVKYKHHHIGSDRVVGLVYSPQGLLNLEQAWLAKGAQ
jgi:peptide/nickel transport system substrate-binding protein/oligopeptide transport system substrate-binding protein